MTDQERIDEIDNKIISIAEKAADGIDEVLACLQLGAAMMFQVRDRDTGMSMIRSSASKGLVLLHIFEDHVALLRDLIREVSHPEFNMDDFRLWCQKFSQLEFLVDTSLLHDQE